MNNPFVTSPTDIVQGQLDAYNAQDIEGYCAFFTDDVVVADLNGQVTCEGLAAYREKYAKTFAEFPENHAELLNRIAVGAFVIDHERVSRKPGGASFDVAAIYTITGRKIARVDFVK